MGAKPNKERKHSKLRCGFPLAMIADFVQFAAVASHMNAQTVDCSKRVLSIHLLRGKTETIETHDVLHAVKSGSAATATRICFADFSGQCNGAMSIPNVVVKSVINENVANAPSGRTAMKWASPNGQGAKTVDTSNVSIASAV